MTIETYNKEDLIPLTICVLRKLGLQQIIFTIKFIVHNVYPDLEGLINTDEIDQDGLELFDAFDLEVDNLTFNNCMAIENVFLSLANIYGLDIKKVLMDERINELAAHFYWYTVIDEFPRNDDGDHNEDEDHQGEYIRVASAANLDLYALSMINAVNFICKMLCNPTIDWDCSWSDECFYFDFMRQDYTLQDHAVALNMLQNLGEILHQNHMDTMDMTDKYGIKEPRRRRNKIR